MDETDSTKKSNNKQSFRKHYRIGMLLCAVSLAAGLSVWGGLAIQRELDAAAEVSAIKEETPAPVDETKLFLMQSPSGMWGYIDKNGEVKIYPQYDSAENFSADGLALVEQNGKWGYIDKTGTYVIGPGSSEEFFSADQVKSIYANKTAKWEKREEASLLPFNVYGKWGFVSANGDVVVPFRYDAVSAFSEGLAAVYDGNLYGYIDEIGNSVVSPKFNSATDFNAAGLAVVSYQGLYGMIDKTGYEVVPCQYQEIGVLDDSGLIPVMDYDTYLWGYINEAGEEVISCLYDEAGQFGDDEYAIIYLDERSGFVDKTGNEIMLEDYCYISANSGTYYIITDEIDQHAIVDVSKEITNIKWYDYATIFDREKGIAEVSQNDRIGLISMDGTWQTEITYDYIEYTDENGIALVLQDGLAGGVKILEKEIIPPIYDTITYYNHQYYAEKDGKMGVLDKNNEIVFPFDYDVMLPLQLLDESLGDVILTGVDDQFGMLNSSFEVVDEFETVDRNSKMNELLLTEFNYEILAAEEFMIEDGDYQMAREMLLYLFAYLKKHESPILNGFSEEDYDTYYPEYYHYSIDEGYSIIEKDSLYGVTDPNNNIIVDIQYDNISFFDEFSYMLTLGDKYGLMDHKGNIIIEPVCTTIDVMNEWGLYPIYKNTGFEYVNQYGECVLSALPPQ